nr:lipid ABC transporter permease/ATP-binding protein [Candidatus Methylopumilus sp.]
MAKSSPTKLHAHQYSAKMLYLRMLKYALRYWQMFGFSILALVAFSATNTGFLATIKLVTDAG